jgi:predicted transcriptional regulator
MEVESWTEEDLKNKAIIPFFTERGFDLFDMEFETPFSVVAGSKKITVRSDIVVKKNGRPIMVVEAKKPNHKITQDDIDQAISYARLYETIVPFAMVTNLEETKLFNAHSRSEVRSKKSYNQTLQECHEWSIDDELKFETFRALCKLNYDFLLDFCGVQRKTQMMHLLNTKAGTRKYAQNLYLDRQLADTRFQEFLDSQDQCFALIGEQGTGKTFDMINLAEKYGQSQPALFYDAAFVPGALKEIIEEDFGWGRKRKLWIGDLFVRVDEILKKHRTQMIIFLDAINEPIPMRARKVDLVNLFRRLRETSIKFCVACRTQDWRFFSMDRGEIGVISWLTYIRRGKKTLSGYVEEGDKGLASCKLTSFSDTELDRAFMKYKVAFDLKSGLAKEAREICKHPETLGIISEIYSHNVIPYSLRRRKILDKFWQRRVESIGDHHIAIEHLLSTIGQLILDSKTPEIRQNALIEHINWNDTYQKIYERAVSENVLLIRKDYHGNKFIRLFPNILMEYLLTKLLLEKYPSRGPDETVGNVRAIIEEFKDFAPLSGILLLYSSFQNNPPELLSYLIEKVNVENVIDQVLDENPEVVDVILTEKNFREKLIRILFGDGDLYEMVRIIIKLLTRKENQSRQLILELMLSTESPKDLILVSQIVKFVMERSQFDKAYSNLLNSLFKELEERGQREFADFLYSISLINLKLSRKLLTRFRVLRGGTGKLKYLITSTLDMKEAGRSLYLLSKINPSVVSRVDPSGRFLRDYVKYLEAGKIAPPDPVRVSRDHLTSLKTVQLQERPLRRLLEDSDGLTWKQISDQLGIDKYKLLATLEKLIKEGILYREAKHEGRYTYKIREKWRMREKIPSVKHKTAVREFTEAIVSSNFNLKPEDLDKFIEDRMLWNYFTKWWDTLSFVFGVLGRCVVVSKRNGSYVLEIVGKTLCFLVEWLKNSGGFRKPLAKHITDEISKIAPAMFACAILGQRTQSSVKGALGEIRNLEEFEKKLDEFSVFFGRLGVRPPTKDRVFEECLRSIKGSPKTRHLTRLREIFNEKITESQPFEEEIISMRRQAEKARARLSEGRETLKTGQVPSYDLQKLSDKLQVKIDSLRKVTQTLVGSFNGLTWDRIYGKLRDRLEDKYKILGSLEKLVREGIVHRELGEDNRFTYKVAEDWSPPEDSSEFYSYLISLGMKKDESVVMEFVNEIVASNFMLTPTEVDWLIEKMMLGSYLEDIKATTEFGFVVLSSSLDVAIQREIFTLEIPGKTLCFLVEWLKTLGGFRRIAAKSLTYQISKTAPAMFKNMIFGVRASQRARTKKPIEIQNLKQFNKRLGEFKMFFGSIGVRTPTKDLILMECVKSLKKMKYTKRVEFTCRLKGIFEEEDIDLLLHETGSSDERKSASKI